MSRGEHKSMKQHRHEVKLYTIPAGANKLRLRPVEIPHELPFKQKQELMENNAFVELTKKYPMAPRSLRKKYARVIARDWKEGDAQHGLALLQRVYKAIEGEMP